MVEDFVEAHIRKLCVILRSRAGVLRGLYVLVSPPEGYIGRSFILLIVLKQ